MRRLQAILLVGALAGCRGEPVDAPALDAAVPPDAAADSSATPDVDDTGAPDSLVADSAVADSMGGDSAAADSALADSAPIDSVAPDTAPADSTAVDTAPADSTAVDTALPDAADASLLDALVEDTAVGNDLACGATRGARMVFIPVAPSFCIDAREVTAAEYVGFLAATDKPVEKGFCAWNAGNYGNAAAIVADSKPITNIDWCDAYAYCEWAGKHLCGDRNTAGPSSTSEYLDSQWSVACRNGPADWEWPMSATALPSATLCRVDSPVVGPAVVATYPACRGPSAPYDRVFDLSGNVAEWDQSGTRDTLFLDAGVTDFRTVGAGVRGGSYASDVSSSRCRTGIYKNLDTKSSEIGFRCCKGPF